MSDEEIVFNHIMSTLPAQQVKAEVIVNALTLMVSGWQREREAVVMANRLLSTPGVRSASTHALVGYFALKGL